MSRERARTYAEAREYVRLRGAGCAGHGFLVRDGDQYPDDEDWIITLVAACEQDDAERTYEFAVDPPVPADGGWSFGPGRSRLLDPGDWALVAHNLDESIGQVLAGPPVPESVTLALDLLARAAGAVAEVAKFIPAGADAVPAGAFGTAWGQTAHARRPEVFTVAGLRQRTEEYREAARVIREAVR